MIALLVIAILVVLILGHELGHFIVAKLMGVRVVEFGLGYPPRAFKIGRWGGTEYTINWLPFGGFVRLYGDELEHEEASATKKYQSLANAPLYAQGLILVAGIIMNVLLGWALFSIAFMQGLPTSVPEGTPGAHLVVNGVLANSPAEVAGMKTGDEIVKMTADDGTSAEDMTPTSVISFVEAHGGKKIVVTYDRGGTTESATIIPAHAVLTETAGRPALGVALALVSETHVSVWGAIAAGFFRTIDILTQVSVGIFQLIVNGLQGHLDLTQVIGPVGLVGVVGTEAAYGIGQILGIAAFISINLAVINLIPIPAFDGGRLLFVALEGIFRRRIPSIIAQSFNLAGFGLIIILMVLVTYHDIAHLLG